MSDDMTIKVNGSEYVLRTDGDGLQVGRRIGGGSGGDITWLDTVELPDDERETVSSCLRQLKFLGRELDRLDAAIAESALEQQSIRLLLTVPGVNLTTAAVGAGISSGLLTWGFVPRSDRLGPALFGLPLQLQTPSS